MERIEIQPATFPKLNECLIYEFGDTNPLVGLLVKDYLPQVHRTQTCILIDPDPDKTSEWLSTHDNYERLLSIRGPGLIDCACEVLIVQFHPEGQVPADVTPESVIVIVYASNRLEYTGDSCITGSPEALAKFRELVKGWEDEREAELAA